MLPGIGDLLLTPHAPLANRRNHAELGVEGRQGGLDPHLVVSLPGAAVGDRVAARAASLGDGELGDQRPPSAVNSG